MHHPAAVVALYVVHHPVVVVVALYAGPCCCCHCTVLWVPLLLSRTSQPSVDSCRHLEAKTADGHEAERENPLVNHGQFECQAVKEMFPGGLQPLCCCLL